MTSGMAGGAKALDDRCGGLTRGERDDNAFPAPAADLRGADDGLGRIIATLHDDIRAERLDQLERGVLVEHRHGIDCLQTGEDVGALGLAAHRAIGPLQSPHAGVAVQPDDEGITTLARAAEHVEMPGVQQIEHTIREDDAAPLLLAPCASAIPVEDLARRVEGAQKALSTRG